MKRILTLLALTGFALASTGCSGNLGDQGAKFMEDLGSAMEANKDDCDKMATALKSVVDDNKGLMEKMKNLPKEKQAEFRKDEKLKARMMAASKKIESAGKACRKHEGVKLAMKAAR